MPEGTFSGRPDLSPRRKPGLLTRFRDLAADPRRVADLVGHYASLPFESGRAQLSYLRSLTRRRKNFVIEEWSGGQDLASASKVAVFGHFDPRGAVDDFVFPYLQQIAEVGFTLIFVSNSPRLDAVSVSRLRPSCGLILRRANVGYDFGAYKDGIARVPELHRLDALLLANDSVYGPLRPLKEIIARMDDRADVWGITDSWVHHHHLQSYFLLFSRSALRSAGFLRYWAQLPYVNSKRWIIRSGEVDLSRELSTDGIRCRALFPLSTAAAKLLRTMSDGGNARIDSLDPAHQEFLRRLAFAIERNRPVNSSLFFWDYLVRQGCPFLKRELLRDNPARAPFVGQWEKVVGTASSYDTGLIARHLDATMRGQPLRDPIPPDRPYQAWFS